MWEKLWFDEHLTKRIYRTLANRVGRLSPETGLIEPRHDSMNYDTNWLFFGHTTGMRDCYLWHEIMFNYFDLVPEFCRLHCYKVVVKIHSVRDLIQFWGIANAAACINANISPYHGKCGIDTRWYTDSPYDAFFYCNSLEEGRERYHHVRALVDAHLENGSSIPIILKRSCTEFEQRYGATDGEFWKAFPPEDRDLQMRLEDIYRGIWQIVAQPDWLKNRVFRRWLEWANTIGDKSYTDLYGHDFLTMKAVTYHLPPPQASTPLTLVERKDKIVSKQRKKPAKGARKTSKSGG
jgi:hypothetical protein